MGNRRPAGKPVLLSNGLTPRQNVLLCEINSCLGLDIPCGTRRSYLARQLARMGRCRCRVRSTQGALWLHVWPLDMKKAWIEACSKS